MSEEVVKEIIEKALKDEEFRTNLFRNPRKALEGYDLSKADLAILEKINEHNFDEFVGKLGDRGTKGVIRPGFG